MVPPEPCEALGESLPGLSLSVCTMVISGASRILGGERKGLMDAARAADSLPEPGLLAAAPLRAHVRVWEKTLGRVWSSLELPNPGLRAGEAAGTWTEEGDIGACLGPRRPPREIVVSERAVEDFSILKCFC